MSHRLRFGRRLRLRRAADFERLFQRSCRSSDEVLTVLATHNGTDVPRLGLAISRKAGGGSVGRNRIKRLIRESFRVNAARLRGLDVLVIGRGGLVGAEARVVRDSLERHWQAVSERCERS